MNKIILALTLVFLTSCDPTTQNPTDSKPTSAAGSISIGDSSSVCYRKLQNLFSQDSAMYLCIIGNVFMDIDDAAEILPLYEEVCVDSLGGTSRGIQIAFTRDTVSSIWTNGGQHLHIWPTDAPETMRIEEGDSRSAVAGKLSLLKQSTEYESFVQQVSLLSKDLRTDADRFMLDRTQWYLTREIASDTILETQLHFNNQLLDSIAIVKDWLMPCPI
jgi:hypothetical protein